MRAYVYVCVYVCVCVCVCVVVRKCVFACVLFDNRRRKKSENRRRSATSQMPAAPGGQRLARLQDHQNDKRDTLQCQRHLSERTVKPEVARTVSPDHRPERPGRAAAGRRRDTGSHWRPPVVNELSRARARYQVNERRDEVTAHSRDRHGRPGRLSNTHARTTLLATQSAAHSGVRRLTWTRSLAERRAVRLTWLE